jgi:hypothetical protein
MAEQAKSKRQRVEFPLADKIWLLDFARSKPRTSAVDLGTWDVILLFHCKCTLTQTQTTNSSQQKPTAVSYRMLNHIGLNRSSVV